MEVSDAANDELYWLNWIDECHGRLESIGRRMEWNHKWNLMMKGIMNIPMKANSDKWYEVIVYEWKGVIKVNELQNSIFQSKNGVMMLI